VKARHAFLVACGWVANACAGAGAGTSQNGAAVQPETSPHLVGERSEEQLPDIPITVEVRIDAQAGRLPISPLLFGKQVASRAVAHAGATRNPNLQLVKDSGLRLTREAWGNNSTKYNWQNGLSSHPDWYNNVYPQHYEEAARWVFNNFDGQLQPLLGLPVLGWVAATDKHNFDEKKDPGNQRRGDNLAGGGNPKLYLKKIDAKYAVDMLDHWFTKLGFEPARLPLWQLDNEPEGWASTHDDVVKTWMTPQEAVQKYIDVAKEFKARYPKLRLMGPGFMEEWHWWTWHNDFVQGLPWAEYFIKRLAEASRAAGRGLIDIISYHGYISQSKHTVSDADLLQEHRIYYDPSYVFPRANGVKKYPEGWDEARKTEMIFRRTEQWLDKYFGPGHGITIGVTEAGYSSRDPMVYALWYASMLGTFADHGVEVFTPWSWEEQLWEVLHVFSRHGQAVRIESKSSNEAMVSAYSSINERGDAATVILVNRNPSGAEGVRLDISGFLPLNAQHEILILEDLRSELSFKSATDNALQRSTARALNRELRLELPPYSIVAVKLRAT
jgi:hypothetical protein